MKRLTPWVLALQAVSQMITDDWSDDEDGDEPLGTWFPQVVIVCCALCSCWLRFKWCW